MARHAKSGDTVSVHYTGTLEDGTVFDSSRDGDPIEFQLGGGAVIGGFERAIEGMEVGEEREIRIEPDDAYGQRREDLRVDVPREQLPDGVEPEVGQMLAIQVTPDQQALARIAEVEGDQVTLDLNHPLAGETLKFSIELVGIR